MRFHINIVENIDKYVAPITENILVQLDSLQSGYGSFFG